MSEGFGIMTNERQTFYGFQSKTLMLFSFKKPVAQKRLNIFGDYNGKVKYSLLTSLIPSPVCSFCDNNDESLRHLFVHCSFVSTFWDQILIWNPICRDNFVNLDDNAILFGIPSTGQTEGNYLILNTIILVGKQTIYQCRKKLIKPSFPLFLAKIDHLKSLEYQIAKKGGKLATFFDKWKNVQ